MDTPKIEHDEGLVVPPKPTVHKNASWNAILSIIIILAMVVIGAFYAWGKRIAEERPQAIPIPAATIHSQTY